MCALAVASVAMGDNFMG